MATDLNSVVARLAAGVRQSHLTADSSQQAAARSLDRLGAELRDQGSLAQRVRATLHRLKARPNQTPATGVYLWGGVGRGKTLLMDLFHDTLGSVPSERTHFYRFMQQIHAELRSVGGHADPLVVVSERLAARVRLICLDELFVSDIADAMILAGLFDGLFKRGVSLVATSNVAPKDLYKDGLQRQRFLPAIDLIERHLEVVQLDGGVDYRLRQLEQAPTYLDSRSADSTTQLAARFATLAGGGASGRTTLDIEARPINALATGPGLVWFTFNELCDGPRSQNDYIEIARVYHTVFVSDVPVFTALNENAARRFIMLVDELYDRSVNLVLSAAAAPTELYQGEKLRFEFERAASRLIEMQTEQYLAGEHRP